ncbi:MAG: pantetheine-phosphate adenylyltransferase [Alphaproteobacteria bacterium]
MSRERVGVYPGTFDPITNGHVDIIRRALRVCDRLIVGVAINVGKDPMFELAQRVALVEHEIKLLNDVSKGGKAEVRPFKNLLMHFVMECNASMVVRGLRAVSDFEYEFQMAGMNSRLNSEVETVFLMASENHQFISSRFVKEIANLGGEIKSFVPPNVVKALAERIKAKS